VAGARDQDWFAVDAAAGSLVVAIDGGATDLDLYIVRNGTEIVARSDTETGAETINGTLDVDKRIVILVNPFVNAQTGAAAEGPYTLSLDCTQSGPPPPEPVDPPPPDPSDPTDPTNPTDPTDPRDEDDDGGDPTAPRTQAPTTGGPGNVGLLADGGCAQSTTSTSAAPLLGLLLLLRRRRR